MPPKVTICRIAKFDGVKPSLEWLYILEKAIGCLSAHASVSEMDVDLDNVDHLMSFGYSTQSKTGSKDKSALSEKMGIGLRSW